MKNFLLKLWMFLFFYSVTNAQEIYKIDKLHKLLKYCESDSIGKLELLASIEFHKILNEYRKNKNKSALAWDETLWVAAYNHSVWMVNNKRLSHSQKKGTPLFSGVNPGDRYNYAASGKSNHSWSGENCLYSYSYNTGNLEETAKKIAQDAFKSWKNSPGHHENMLGNHQKHGVGFVFDRSNSQGLYYATDLFARGLYNETANGDIGNNKISNGKLTNSLNNELNKLEFVRGYNSRSNKISYQLAAEKINMKSDYHDTIISDELFKKRIPEWNIFKKPLNGRCIVISKDSDEYSAEEASKEIKALIREDQIHGSAVIVKKKKEDLRIAIVYMAKGK
jgi:uncharacterized protein YkwD